jgi:hypothetical protein
MVPELIKELKQARELLSRVIQPKELAIEYTALYEEIKQYLED